MTKNRHKCSHPSKQVTSY